jgi:hypothetical protein
VIEGFAFFTQGCYALIEIFFCSGYTIDLVTNWIFCYFVRNLSAFQRYPPTSFGWLYSAVIAVLPRIDSIFKSIALEIISWLLP